MKIKTFLDIAKSRFTGLIPLSPVDQVFMGEHGYPVEFAFSYPYAIDPERFRKALVRTTSRFWPVTAELVPHPEWGYAFQRSAQRPDLVVMEADRLPDMRDPVALAPFSRHVVTKPGHPLAKFQLVSTENGTLVVASVSHSVVDGYSYFFFLAFLAAAYRGQLWSRDHWQKMLLWPDLERRKLVPSPIEQNTNTATDTDRLKRDVVFERTGLVQREHRQLPPLAESKWEFIKFSASDLQATLKEANAAISGRLSAHDVMTASLWKRAAGEWHQSDEPLSCSSAFDYRRVTSSLSPLYFGNAIRATGLVLSRSDVLSLSLGELASRVRSATRAVDEAAVWDSLRCCDEIRRNSGSEALQSLHVADPRAGLLVTNLSRVPLSQLDFGEGRPEQVIPLTSVSRTAVLLADGESIVARWSPPE